MCLLIFDICFFFDTYVFLSMDSFFSVWICASCLVSSTAGHEYRIVISVFWDRLPVFVYDNFSDLWKLSFFMLSSPLFYLLGFGNIYPVNSRERLYASLVMIVGAFITTGAKEWVGRKRERGSAMLSSLRFFHTKSLNGFMKRPIRLFMYENNWDICLIFYPSMMIICLFMYQQGIILSMRDLLETQNLQSKEIRSKSAEFLEYLEQKKIPEQLKMQAKVVGTFWIFDSAFSTLSLSYLNLQKELNNSVLIPSCSSSSYLHSCSPFLSLFFISYFFASSILNLLQSAYSYYLQRRPTVAESDIFDELPKHVLLKMVNHLYRLDIQAVRLFHTTDEFFMAQLVIYSKPHHAVVRMHSIYLYLWLFFGIIVSHF